METFPFLQGAKWTIGRLARTSFAFRMHLTMVLLVTVIVLSLICSLTSFRQTEAHHFNVRLSEKKESVALQANLTHLKDAIKSIRQQKRAILSRQLDNDLSPELDRRKTSAKAEIAFKYPSEQSPNDLSNLIENKIFWSSNVEEMIPRGFTRQNDIAFVKTLQNVSLVEATVGCGRQQNRLLTTSLNEKICARYRNSDQVQGEYVSFLLARILRISNVPPTVLVSSAFLQAPRSGPDWGPVRAKLKEAQWESKPVVLTKFVNELGPAFTPSLLRTSRRHLHPVRQDLEHLNRNDLIELVQWSDMIVLDYLTANLDRMLNNMINQRWNSQMMDNPVHNLLRHQTSHLLLFIDNESALFHGYRLLKKFDSLHRSLLEMLCIFRKSTVERLHMLDDMTPKEFAQLLRSQYKEHLISESPNAPGANLYAILPKANVQILRKRIRQVLHQVSKCGERFQ